VDEFHLRLALDNKFAEADFFAFATHSKEGIGKRDPQQFRGHSIIGAQRRVQADTARFLPAYAGQGSRSTC